MNLDDRVTDPFGYWLSGFIDGEGCFSISKRATPGQYTPRFDLHLRMDDKPIILDIHQTMKIGNVSYRKAHALSQPTVGWYVVSKADALDLVAFIRRYPLRAKKKQDFELWSQAVIEYNLPQGKRDWERIGALYTTLKESRKAGLAN